jgi:hypothetical protein
LHYIRLFESWRWLFEAQNPLHGRGPMHRAHCPLDLFRTNIYIFIIVTVSLRLILKLSSFDIFTLSMGNVSAPVAGLVTELAQCQIGNSRGRLLCSNTCCHNSSIVRASGCSDVWPVFWLRAFSFYSCCYEWKIAGWRIQVWMGW